MAKQLITYANTAAYTFKIYDVNDTASWIPSESTIADWEISYQAQDNILPGVIPSTFSASFFGGPAVGTWRSLLQDAEFSYAVEVHEGLNILWRGFITPDLCSIEVINGQRFIKIVASDGFQGLQLQGDIYQYTGVKAFTDQIADIFTRANLFRIFTGYYVSEHFQPKDLTVTDLQGGLWWTGTLQAGHYVENGQYRTLGEALNDVLTIFGLQLFQDRGELVFRTCHLQTPAWYNYYSSFGTFVGRITPTGPTVTPAVFSNGVEMYKPAISKISLTYSQAPLSDFIGQDNTFRDRSNWFVAYGLSTGGNHIDFSGVLRARYEIPANYNDTVIFYWDVQIRYGNYFWTGSQWSTTPSSVSYDRRVHINGDDEPTLGITDLNINAVHLDDFPAIGWQPIYYTVTGSYDGEELGDYVSQSTYYFHYHHAAPSSLLFLTDNTERLNGVTINLSSNIGDKPGESVSTPSAGALRKFSTSARTSTVASQYWDASDLPLIIKTIYELNRKNYAPYQYYELDLNGVISYNHLFNWGSVYYKPINLSITERSTRVTYRQYIDGDLVSNYFSGRPPFNP